MSENDKLKKKYDILLKKIDEYESLENYFGIDKHGDILFDEEKDLQLLNEHVDSENTYEYTGYDDFMDWVNYKNKKELKQELSEIKDMLDNKDKIIGPSDEQKKIVEKVTAKKNVIVDAVAGSGKTTTVLFIAQNNPKKNILQITYNKQLKLEVRQKVLSKKIDNLEIHTYHSLTVNFYDEHAHTDDKIIKILLNNSEPKKKKNYDILIIDEVQDMTPNYFTLICKFINDMNLKATIVILGDKYQGIYEFKNADTRFLTLSNKIWKNHDDFITLPLKQSYRVTKQIATFINKTMLGYDRILSTKNSKYNVQYYKKSLYMVHTIFVNLILKQLKDGYRPDDIFILAPSLKSSSSHSPIKKLENKLATENIPVYFPRSEEENLNEDILKGKIVFSSFHQSKGRERKIVYIFGFDDTYFDFHCKEKDRNTCPSELYVAVTRASEILVLFESEQNEQLSFMKYDAEQLKRSTFTDYYDTFNKKKESKNIKKKKNTEEITSDFHKISVTELTKYIGEQNINNIIPLINQIVEITTPVKEKYTVDIPSNVKMHSGLTEDVSDLNGMVIPAMYDAKTHDNNSTLQKIIEEKYETTDKKIKDFIDNNSKKLHKYLESNVNEGYLCMGNLYIAIVERLHSKIKQIDRYDWLTKDMIKICHKNLSKNICGEAIYEQELGTFENENGYFFQYDSPEHGIINITARVDCYDDESLWEFKCVKSITIEHILQLIVYAWIWEKCMTNDHGRKKYKILNIRTGEVKTVNYKKHIVEDILKILFDNKYLQKINDDDNVFITKCHKIVDQCVANKKLQKELFEFNTKSHNNDPDDECDDDSENYITHSIINMK